MVDSCPSHGSEDEVFEMLMHNFRRHFNSNRAPLGLYFHTIWFKKRINLRAFQVHGTFLIVEPSSGWMINFFSSLC